MYPLKFLAIRASCGSMLASALVPFDYSVNLINMYAGYLGTYFAIMLLDISAVNTPSVGIGGIFCRLAVHLSTKASN